MSNFDHLKTEAIVRAPSLYNTDYGIFFLSTGLMPVTISMSTQYICKAIHTTGSVLPTN